MTGRRVVIRYAAEKIGLAARSSHTATDGTTVGSRRRTNQVPVSYALFAASACCWSSYAAVVDYGSSRRRSVRVACRLPHPVSEVAVQAPRPFQRPVHLKEAVDHPG